MTIILGLFSFFAFLIGGCYLIVFRFPADPANQKIRYLIQLCIAFVYCYLVFMSWFLTLFEADNIFEFFPMWWENLLYVLSF